ncbi:MAG: EAL domain-containing protein [Candidatus Accumulibacter sp.]|jgi:EAL domain-containing protein (putative c-di-GMP-specific phosphodiesterase class I)/GGDEF domain-containing protein|nr:EAL domain-containing protein [Accumulibacter sp.]
MSMYRQLWLAIITSMLLALGGSLLASLLSSRSYLEAQLSQKNTDNATVLALALSQGGVDALTVELAVSALFDSGHYELIRVVDPIGRNIVEKRMESGDSDVPSWFVKYLPLAAAPGYAQISDGWKQFGTITLVSHDRYAYRALWQGALRISGSLVIACVIGGLLGTLILLRLKAPLAAVVEQARAISERRFTTIGEPDVPELKQLAVAMNGTVLRLKTIFEEEAARLEAVRREANFDVLTGLANRAHFMAHFDGAARGEDSAGGVLFIVRIARLAEVNRSLGREATDALLQRFGAVLREFSGKYPEALGARLNGADLALLMPAEVVPETVGEPLLKRLVQEAAAFRESPQEPVVTWLSGGGFAHGMAPATILAQIDAALAACESDGRNALRIVDIRSAGGVPSTARDWSENIQGALDRGWIRLAAFPVMCFDDVPLHDECALRLKFDADGEWLPAGCFMPQAERLQLTARIDLAAVRLGLGELEARPDLAGLAINVSARSLQSPSFHRELLALLAPHPAAPRLWLEVAESGVLVHLEAFGELCRELKSIGCRIGIEHFGHHFSEIGRLYGVGIDYLKVDAIFVRDLHANLGNQTFLRGLATIARNFGITVIAEGVVDKRELEALAATGFDAATGPCVRR